MLCPQREQILAEYRNAVESLTALAVASKDPSSAGSHEIQERIDVAICASGKARVNLREHMDEHHCWTHSAGSSLFLWRTTLAGTAKSQSAA
jgi:hypothetical protein